ncbi:hypothetical protein SAMN05444161_2950 [Rhizobiales bacterium GAS191]|nr:hypothetical protein SAMN05444161_2950 [Rhizobiales bacterium GAS191]
MRAALVALATILSACVAAQDDASGTAAANGLFAMQNARSTGFPATRTALIPFDVTPFPYSGMIPDTDKPFLDVTDGERHGHSSPRGGIVWEDQAYRDHRVLLSIPAGFDLDRPAVIVVYFHGNNATLERDVAARQQVPRQLADSGLNAVLVAPQFAVNAGDSSAGRFWEPNVFGRFIDEAASHLATLYGSERAASILHSAPVVFVAYSGGYLPAAFSLKYWGDSGRLRGVILMDAAYGELDKFADWIAARRDAFFFSAYSKSTNDGNLSLQQLLSQRGVGFDTRAAATLAGGSVTFLRAPDEVVHNDFVSRAWTTDPLASVLSRIGGFPRPGAGGKARLKRT